MNEEDIKIDERHFLSKWFDRYLGCRFLIERSQQLVAIDCELLGTICLHLIKSGKLPNSSMDFMIDFTNPLKREWALLRFRVGASLCNLYSQSSLTIQVCKSGKNPDFLDHVFLKRISFL